MSFNDYQEILEKNNETFKQQPNNQYDELPDGVYNCKITSANMEKSKKKETLQLVVKVRIEGPNYIGKTQPLFYDLENPNGLKFLRWLLSTLNLQSDDLTQLPLLAEQMIGEFLDIKVGTNQKGFKTYYPQKLKVENISPDYSLQEPTINF